MKKQIITGGIAAAVGLTGLTGVAVANAESGTDSSSNPMSSLVSAIASKFNLNQDEVQAVFDEQHQAMEQERETQRKDDLAQLVTDGKLTQAQADAINAKHDELEKEREANRSSDQSLSRSEMKSKMDSKRSELKAWAKEQGIDAQYLRYVMGGPGHGGPGGPHGDRDGDDTQDSSSTTDQ